MKTKAQKLREAVTLLREVSAEWDEDEVAYYPEEFPSFDELVNTISDIEFKEK